MSDMLVFFVGVDIAIVALDVFRYSVIALSIDVRSD